MIPALGFVYGLVAGAMSVGSLWLIVRLAARLARSIAGRGSRIAEQGPDEGDEHAIQDRRSAIVATFTILLAFLLKAPVLILIARGAQTLGIAGVYWCVAGVMLVYFVAVFWAAGRTNRL